MTSSQEQALNIFEVYYRTESIDEFIHVMKGKTDLCNGDVEMLWHLMSLSYSKGFDDNYDL